MSAGRKVQEGALGDGLAGAAARWRCHVLKQRSAGCLRDQRHSRCSGNAVYTAHLGLSAAGLGGASAACARTEAARRGAPSRRAGLTSARVARGRLQRTTAAAGAAAVRQVAACMAGCLPKTVAAIWRWLGERGGRKRAGGARASWSAAVGLFGRPSYDRSDLGGLGKRVIP